MSTKTEEAKTFFKNHPRMTGVLFTILLVLSQANTALATNASVTTGP